MKDVLLLTVCWYLDQKQSREAHAAAGTGEEITLSLTTLHLLLYDA